MMKPIRVRDIMTDEEKDSFKKLNSAILTSSTKMERNYYNRKIKKIIKNAKDRYFNMEK